MGRPRSDCKEPAGRLAVRPETCRTPVRSLERTRSLRDCRSRPCTPRCTQGTQCMRGYQAPSHTGSLLRCSRSDELYANFHFGVERGRELVDVVKIEWYERIEVDSPAASDWQALGPVPSNTRDRYDLRMDTLGQTYF